MDSSETFTLCGRPVGPAHPPFVIAEAGVNHDGDVGLARRLIDAARQAGADAVKFQVFNADRLAAEDAPACSYQHHHDPRATGQRDMLRRLELPAEAFAELQAHARRTGLPFLATPFGLEELRRLIALDVPAIKIASPDLVNVPLLTAAAAAGRPLILSTGGATRDEIDRAVALVRDRPGPPPLMLLHCVSAYPAEAAGARLRCIQALRDDFKTLVGFSDHTEDPAFSALAVPAGAVVLEKHLTLDRRGAGPDHFFSLEPAAFAEYVTAARRAWEAMGDGRFVLSPAEEEVRRLARGSITAAVAIPAGQPLDARCLTVRRPAGGLDPSAWHEVIGRRARTDIPAGTRLSPGMID